MELKYTEEDIDKAIQKGIVLGVETFNLEKTKETLLCNTIYKIYHQNDRPLFINSLDKGYIKPISSISPTLGMKVVYAERYISETFTIVGIRENEIELRGDWSGIGLCNAPQWCEIDKVFVDIRKLK